MYIFHINMKIYNASWDMKVNSSQVSDTSVFWQKNQYLSQRNEMLLQNHFDFILPLDT